MMPTFASMYLIEIGFKDWLLYFFQVHPAFWAGAGLVVGLVALVFHGALVNGGMLVAVVHLVVLMLGWVIPASSE